MSKRRSRSRHHRRHRRNMIENTLSSSVNMVKSTSKKYMPKFKSSLENVGSKVVSSSSKSVPFLQRMTRKLFGMIGLKTRRRGRH